MLFGHSERSVNVNEVFPKGSLRSRLMTPQDHSFFGLLLKENRKGYANCIGRINLLAASG